MKPRHFFSIAFTLLFSTHLMAQRAAAVEQNMQKEETDEAQQRNAFELLRLHDPATGKIPPRIRARELSFAKTIPSRESLSEDFFKSHGASVLSATWTPRGPFNIGGRTRALGIDANNENVLIAGGVSGGVWRSTNQGATWVRTSALNSVQGASCVAQDIRIGHANTWYYGTGEYQGNSASSIADSTMIAEYYGNGIFKSIDSGKSWTQLPSTITADNFGQNQPFDFVFSIAVDQSQLNNDIVYAATSGSVMRSSDGGTTWATSIGGSGGDGKFTDVKVVNGGAVYAAISREQNSPTSGIQRSIDGLHWTSITPTGFPATTYRIVIAAAPSDQNIIYALADLNGKTGPGSTALWKYTYRSGDGSGSGGTWEDLSANLPSDINTQNSYDLHVNVKPDDANVVFVGGVWLYRSTDGFATPNNVTAIGGYSYSFHPDEHAVVFSPRDPAMMYAGNDGGVFQTLNDLDSTVNWNDLNSGYMNSQFYNIGIDHATSASPLILGGMQDNGSSLSYSKNILDPWNSIFGGDGADCAIANGGASCCLSSEFGDIYRVDLDSNFYAADFTYVVPSGASRFQFINPFILDANNSNIMYLPEYHTLWRNSDLSDIPINNYEPTSVNWQQLSNVKISSGIFSALAVSTVPANRLYIGTTVGALYRIDSANSGDPAQKDIYSKKGFPPNAYISCIAVDPTNADNVMLVFSNYNVKSLFYTSDGGSTWTPAGGNLEQNADGTGDGPSCRWAAILPVGNKKIFLVGTSIGLFSTESLNGAFTFWVQEGASQLGNAVVDVIDERAADGFVAVGTHGLGVFTATLTPTEQPAALPTLLSPPNGATFIPDPAILKWSATTNNNSYHLQVSVSSDFSTLANEQDVVGTTTASVPNLLYTVDYYWRVQAVGDGGASAFTPAWKFTTLPGPPLSPALLAPANTASGLSTSPTLQWSADHDAQFYHLQIAKAFSFVTLVYDDSTLTDTLTTIPTLANNQRYYWHVNARNNYGTSSYSTFRNFTVGTLGVAEAAAPLATTMQLQNFPDPFSEATAITYSLPQHAHAALEIVDALGNVVATLVNDEQDAGTHSTTFHRGGLAAGEYFLRLHVDGKIFSRSIIVQQ